jgi:hypothetical protein
MMCMIVGTIGSCISLINAKRKICLFQHNLVWFLDLQWNKITSSTMISWIIWYHTHQWLGYIRQVSLRFVIFQCFNPWKIDSGPQIVHIICNSKDTFSCTNRSIRKIAKFVPIFCFNRRPNPKLTQWNDKGTNRVNFWFTTWSLRKNGNKIGIFLLFLTTKFISSVIIKDIKHLDWNQ